MSIISIHYNQLNEAMNGHGNVEKIVPGLGATMFCGSDRYMMVVTEVCSPKKIKVAHLLDSHKDKFITGNNGVMILPKEFLDEYKKFVPDEYGWAPYYASQVYTFRKNYRWMPQGKGLWETSSIQIGVAEEYRDPCF